jgi:hypothetical protein
MVLLKLHSAKIRLATDIGERRLRGISPTDSASVVLCVGVQIVMAIFKDNSIP